MGMANIRTDFCPNGHDKRIYGTRNRMCKECRRIKRRAQWTNATPEQKAHIYEQARARYYSGASQFNITVPVCPAGHVKADVGVMKNGGCRACAHEAEHIERAHRTPEERAKKAVQVKAAIARRQSRTGITYLRRTHLKNLYGIDEDTYQRMREEQGDLCAICHRPETRTRSGRLQELQVDHDHASGQTRRLLCNMCNVGLGYFRDDPGLLVTAAEYVRSFRHS